MRRADRLFHLAQLIRDHRLTTAHFLAARLEVSERTIYRDVADLQYQGVPSEGEAGVGYRLGSEFDLPPLMFTHEEASALVAATRLAQARLDPAMAAALLLLGRRVDAGGLVRGPSRLPGVSRGPHHRGRGDGRAFCTSVGSYAARFFARGQKTLNAFII